MATEMLTTKAGAERRACNAGQVLNSGRDASSRFSMVTGRYRKDTGNTALALREDGQDGQDGHS